VNQPSNWELRTGSVRLQVRVKMYGVQEKFRKILDCTYVHYSRNKVGLSFPLFLSNRGSFESTCGFIRLLVYSAFGFRLLVSSAFGFFSFWFIQLLVYSAFGFFSLVQLWFNSWFNSLVQLLFSCSAFDQFSVVQLFVQLFVQQLESFYNFHLKALVLILC